MDIIIITKKRGAVAEIQLNSHYYFLQASLECPGPKEWQFLKLFPGVGSANACCGTTTLGTTTAAAANPMAATIAITAIVVFRLLMFPQRA